MTIGHETLSTPAAPGRPVPEATARSVSFEAFEALANLQRLTLEAGLSESRQQLIFRMLNRTIAYCRYDRAVLWSLSGRRPRLLGVSGSSDVNPQSPLVSEWGRIVAALPNRDAVTVVDPTALRGQSDAWEALARRTNGLSVIWLPIAVDGRRVAALWLERWGGSRFAPGEATRLEALALAYGIAWRSVTRGSRRTLGELAARRRVFVALTMLLLAAALFFIRLPLRIVAPCEVVPNDPVAVTAPLNGVIDEIPVLPGRSIEAGELLAAYDKRVTLEEMKVARQQVQIIKSDLQRARVQAFEDPAARAEIALLENRLAQEEIRLHMAQQRVDRLEVRAPVGGTLMFADPHEWRGRPVQVGERLMLIVDPAHTKLRIWLPEHDNIQFDPSRSLTVVLGSDPSGSRKAALRFLANHSQVNSDGLTCFRAEADWVDPAPDVKMGLKGTAILYGDEVPLGYWLVRRPLAAVRRLAGI